LGIRLLKVVPESPHVTLHDLFLGKGTLAHESLDRRVGNIVGVIFGRGASGQPEHGKDNEEKNREELEWFHPMNLKDLPTKAIREGWTEKDESGNLMHGNEK